MNEGSRNTQVQIGTLNRSDTRKPTYFFWEIFENWIQTGLSKLISVSNRDLGRINHLKKYGESQAIRMDGCDTEQKKVICVDQLV
ncbi:hypothetical protein CYR81_04005 [Enterococcus faecalis]|nr:hypothetical protein CYR81_04005 [Enterococcus faecalis]